MAAPKFAYRLGWRSLRAVVPGLSASQARSLARDLAQAMHDFDISTQTRATMFLAQIAHESGGFVYREEIASGHEYEGRTDLGNTHTGDGARFKGRTYIQITGRSNYVEVSKALGHNFVSRPEDLARQRYACLGAAWWWKQHGCNALADQGSFIAVTRRINGGTNGEASREAYYARARKVGKYLIPKRRPPS